MEDNLEVSNPVKGFVQLCKWLVARAELCLHFKIMLFFGDCVPLGLCYKNKSWSTPVTAGVVNLMWITEKHEHRLLSKSNFILVSHHPSDLFSFRKAVQQAFCDLRLILSSWNS